MKHLDIKLIISESEGTHCSFYISAINRPLKSHRQTNMATSESKTLCQVEQLLEKALILIELTNDLKEKSHVGEKYACDLKSLAWKACQITSAIQQSTKDFLQLAEHIVKSALEIIANDKSDTIKKTTEVNVDRVAGLLPSNFLIETKERKDNTSLIYNELVKLQNILKRDIYLCEKPSEMKLFKTKSSSSIGDMIKTLQTKQQRRKENLSPRICMDDKYPDKTSRESLLDLANPSLQTVHEDDYTDFTRCALETQNNASCGHSISSKSIQRIKRILHMKDGDIGSNISFNHGSNEIGKLEDDLVGCPSESQCELLQSYSVNSIGPRDSDTVLKNNNSNVNILLQNISEED